MPGDGEITDFPDTDLNRARLLPDDDPYVVRVTDIFSAEGVGEADSITAQGLARLFKATTPELGQRDLEKPTTIEFSSDQ